MTIFQKTFKVMVHPWKHSLLLNVNAKKKYISFTEPNKIVKYWQTF